MRGSLGDWHWFGHSGALQGYISRACSEFPWMAKPSLDARKTALRPVPDVRFTGGVLTTIPNSPVPARSLRRVTLLC